MASTVDPSLCPVCGEPNTCGMSQGKTECWCFNLKIPQESLDRVPAEAKNVACICPRCAAAQADEPVR
ncbi:MAG TPA: cysteine-rich CWC family protein [Polyangiaceae bacterium]